MPKKRFRYETKRVVEDFKSPPHREFGLKPGVFRYTFKLPCTPHWGVEYVESPILTATAPGDTAEAALEQLVRINRDWSRPTVTCEGRTVYPVGIPYIATFVYAAVFWKNHKTAVPLTEEEWQAARREKAAKRAERRAANESKLAAQRARNDAVAALRTSGLSAAAVGKQFRISDQRVTQLWAVAKRRDDRAARLARIAENLKRANEIFTPEEQGVLVVMREALDAY